jgi:hypothetical protein
MILEIIEAARTAGRAVDGCREASQELSSLAWKDLVASDVLPHSLPTDWEIVLNRLSESVARAKSQLVDLDEIWNRILAKLVRGEKLERAEFYLFMSTESFRFPDEDYEKFEMLVYKDGERQGYINSHRQRLKPGRLGIGWGILPEDVRVSSLSPEQQEFFKSQAPDTWLRFDHNS